MKRVAGIDYKDLYLVRVQGALNGDRLKNGELVLNRSGSGRAEDTNSVHFTLNAIVKNHTFGKQFNGSEVAIVAPFQRACLEGENIPTGLSPGDTWFHADTEGNVKLPGAKLFVPDDFPLSQGMEKIAIRYPRGNSPEETMKNRNRAIAEVFEELKAPLRDLAGNEGSMSLPWKGYETESQYADLKRLAHHLFPKKEVTVGMLHMNHHDHKWSALLATQTSRMSDYAAGKRLFKTETGFEAELFPDIHERMIEAERFIIDRNERGADPKAIKYYKRTLTALLAQAENLEPLRKKEVIRSFSFDGDFLIRDESFQISGPIKVTDFVLMGLRGELKDKEILQPNAESRIDREWHPYNRSEEKKKIDSIHIRHPYGLDNIGYCADKFVGHYLKYGPKDWHVFQAKEDIEYVLRSSKLDSSERLAALEKIKERTDITWEREQMPDNWKKPGVEEWFKNLGIIQGTKLVFPPRPAQKSRLKNYRALKYPDEKAETEKQGIKTNAHHTHNHRRSTKRGAHLSL